MFKKSALAVVVAASMIPAAAMAEATLYGQARIFFVNEDNGLATTNSDQWDMKSEASRLGVKGSAELDHGLEAIYKLEFEVDPAGDTEGIQKNRNGYVGLKGDFGQVIFGKHDTPLKKSQGKVDLFSDYAGADMKYGLSGEERIDNLVYYKSPKIADAISLHVGFAPGEGNDVDVDGSNDQGIADMTSLAVTYNADNLYFALAHDQNIGDGSKILDGAIETVLDAASNALGGSELTLDNLDSVTRLTGQFKGDGFGIGAIFQTAETSPQNIFTAGNTSVEEEAILLSAYVKASDSIKLKAQLIQTTHDISQANSEFETSIATLGADYKLGKKTTATAYYTTRDTELNAGAATVDVEEADLFGLGLIHKF